MFKGSLTALVTPFRNDAVDEDAFQKFVDCRSRRASTASCPWAPPARCPTLTPRGAQARGRTCDRGRAGRVPVIAGTGLQLDRRGDRPHPAMPKRPAPTRRWWCLPYYNQPDAGRAVSALQGDPRRDQHSDRDLQRAAAQVPSTCRSTPWRAAPSSPRMVGVKDATADLARPTRTSIAIGKDFCQLSGEDATALPFLIQGGRGLHLGDARTWRRS